MGVLLTGLNQAAKVKGKLTFYRDALDFARFKRTAPPSPSRDVFLVGPGAIESVIERGGHVISTGFSRVKSQLFAYGQWLAEHPIHVSMGKILFDI